MVRLRTALPPALLATLVPLGAALGGCGVPDRPPEAGLSVTEALSGDAAGHDRALEPRPFSFPADHAAHPRFRTEWWYVTGNLDAADGRRFGYQLTFFRNALAPPPEPGSGVGNSGSPTTGAGAAERRSAWATRQVWFAHFAVTDAAAGRFVSGERLVRGAAGLAGAELLADGRGLRLHVADWSAETAGDGGSAEGGPAAAGLLPLRLRAAETGGRGRTAVGLTLGPGKPPVLHGDRGLSHKGGAPGNASYYYSFTRLPTSGTLEVDGERLAVTGLSWMDREWSTSALDEDLVGWDWFALQ
ncbi:MAG: carotenoid 1,2-hydratase, partial [Acidobacteriota bacterium]